MAQVEYRFASVDDTALVLDFLKKLAAYENMSDGVTITESELGALLFERHDAEVLFAVADGVEVGFALFFPKPLVWTGVTNIYLEDLFVLPEHRGKGYGRGLLDELARIARERGCGRLEWVCLNWNQAGIDFYRSRGAISQDDWMMFRLGL